MKLQINKDKIKLIEEEDWMSGAINFYEIEVEFSSEWEGLTKVCILTNNCEGIPVSILNNKVIVSNLINGKWNIGFIGYKIENDIKTLQISTELIYKQVFAGAGEIETEEQEVPTPTGWEQYVATMNGILNDTIEIKTDIYNKYDEYNANAEQKTTEFNDNYEIKKSVIDETCSDIEEMKESVEQTKSEVDATAIEVETARQEVSENKDIVEADKEQVAEDKTSVSSTYADFLSQLGSEVATLINGKIPVSQIPSIATTEIYTVTTVEEMNVLSVQNGDICIVTEEDKSYIYNNGWIFLVSPTDYSSRSGYAEQAGIAEDSYKINGKRVISMTQEAYDNAFDNGTLLEDTFYFVPKEE